MVKIKSVINEDILFQYLKEQTSPVLESTLIREFFPHVKDRSMRDLDLTIVQIHFILYHNLHKLALSLLQSDYFLHIYYIYIYLFKKPDPTFCPYFNEKNKRFCLSEKSIEELYCPYHQNKEKKLSQKQILKHKGISGYYLDGNNFDLLNAEYPEFIDQANKIKNIAIYYPELKKHYDIFDLENGSSFDKVQTKYKILAKKYHPDINNSPHAYSKFQKITEAYNYLKKFLNSYNKSL